MSASADKFERAPKPANLEMSQEWAGEEGLVSADFGLLGDSIQVSVETIHGRTTLYASDVEKLFLHLERFKLALEKLREPIHGA